MTRDQIVAEAMALDPVEREALAEELLLSLSEADREAIDAAWLTEVRRRDTAFAKGEISASPVDDAVARVLSRAKR